MSATLTRMDGALYMLVRDHKKLARLLVIQEISYRQLTDALGWGKSHSYVGRLCRGEVRSIDPEAALKIAHLLGASVDDLFVIKVASEAGRNGQDNAA